MAGKGNIIDNKYEILKEIGHGGMSVVYLAMDLRLNKQWGVMFIAHHFFGDHLRLMFWQHSGLHK